MGRRGQVFRAHGNKACPASTTHTAQPSGHPPTVPIPTRCRTPFADTFHPARHTPGRPHSPERTRAAPSSSRDRARATAGSSQHTDALCRGLEPGDRRDPASDAIPPVAEQRVVLHGAPRIHSHFRNSEFTELTP